MRFTGTRTSYKCTGNEGSKTGFASISQGLSDESYSFLNRQYNNFVLSCEDRGTKNKYLIELANEIWKYLLLHRITSTAKYLPCSMNMEED